MKMKQTPQKFLLNLTRDIEKLALSEFDRNFDRQAFFNKPWKKSGRVKRNGGSTLVLTGRMRNDLDSRVVTSGHIEIFTHGAAPYAHAHNNGYKGMVNVPTSKVRAHRKKNKWGRTVKVKEHTRQAHTRQLTLPKRQFVGEHPQLNKRIELEIRQQTRKFLQDLV